MGIQDRDYFREESARKQRMHYDARTATYSDAEPQAQASSNRRPPPRRPVEVKVGADWHWSLKFLLWLAICLLVLLIVRFVNSHA